MNRTQYELYYTERPSGRLQSPVRIMLASNIQSLEDAKAIRDLLRDKYANGKLHLHKVSIMMERTRVEEYFVVVQRDNPAKDSRQYVEADNRRDAALQSVRGMRAETVIHVYVYASEADFRLNRSPMSFTHEELLGF